MELFSPEAELIQKARTGDADAFARLYETYAGEIFRFVYYRVDDAATAEDLTSQVFIKAWDNLARYQPRGSPFKAWLFQIARNLVIDYYRARKESTSLDAYALGQPDPAADVAAQVEQQMEAEWLRGLLHRLTAEQREVLTLKFIHGFSTEEVARVMKRGQGAIRALQMRGLKALEALVRTERDE